MRILFEWCPLKASFLRESGKKFLIVTNHRTLLLLYQKVNHGDEVDSVRKTFQRFRRSQILKIGIIPKIHIEKYV